MESEPGNKYYLLLDHDKAVIGLASSDGCYKRWKIHKPCPLAIEEVKLLSTFPLLSKLVVNHDTKNPWTLKALCVGELWKKGGRLFRENGSVLSEENYTALGVTS